MNDNFFHNSHKENQYSLWEYFLHDYSRSFLFCWSWVCSWRRYSLIFCFALASSRASLSVCDKLNVFVTIWNSYLKTNVIEPSYLVNENVLAFISMYHGRLNVQINSIFVYTWLVLYKDVLLNSLQKSWFWKQLVVNENSIRS